MPDRSRPSCIGCIKNNKIEKRSIEDVRTIREHLRDDVTKNPPFII